MFWLSLDRDEEKRARVQERMKFIEAELARKYVGQEAIRLANTVGLVS